MYKFILDKYFERPILWDYIIAVLITTGLYYIKEKGGLQFAEEDVFKQLISDLGNISLTLAGIILTLITIFISFKSNFDSKKDSDIEVENNPFQTFFQTDLYFDSVKYFRGAMKSLLFIGVLNYALKVFISIYSINHWYLLTVTSIIIIVLTMIRSLMVLGLILDLQSGKK